MCEGARGGGLPCGAVVHCAQPEEREGEPEEDEERDVRDVRAQGADAVREG